MSLRGRLVAYLCAVHLLMALLGIAVLIDTPAWLLVVEATFALSAFVGIALTRRLFTGIDVARSGARLIRDQDFTSRLLPVGQPEMDELISAYNRMVDSLREERARLQEQHHFLGRVLRESPSGILVLDFDRAIDTINPAAERLLAVTAATAAGQAIEALGGTLAPAMAALPVNASEVVAVSATRQVRCHHGTFFDRGFPRSFFLIEELTDELRQAERRAYEKLIRVMAHEVNNSVAASNSLLTSSLAYGAELADGSRADFERAITIVIERTERLNRFMRSFADVFRLPAPARRPEQIIDLVENCAALVGARSEAGQLRWDWEIERRDLMVAIDRNQMEQVLLNVLQNAVDATGGSGTIRIRLRATGVNRPTLHIEDSGPGLAPEAAANLFTPFFSTKPHGQGIGLTLTREILTGHGFDYAIERPPGGPTRFTIVF